MLIRKNSLNKSNIKAEKPKVLKKRRYSNIIDENHVSEPQKKLRKVRQIKPEDDENIVEDVIKDDTVDDSSSEFKEFTKNFSIPSNIYKHLSNRHKVDPILLKRTLSYNIKTQTEFPKSNAQSVVDHLSTARFDNDKIKISNANANQIKSPTKISIRFEQFIDNKLQKDWETVEAFIYVDIVHFHRNNRKNKDGFCTNRVISNQKIYCNSICPEDNEKFVIDIDEIMKGVSTYRVHKSMLHFKILAKEKKLFTRNICQEKKCDDLYPVTYEAMIPLFSNKDANHMHKDAYFIQPGKYEIYPRVTDMEKCDDSMFSGVMNGYDPEEEKVDELDCEWIVMDDIQQLNDNRANTKFVFSIENKEPIKDTQKPLKTRNKSLLPVIELSPINNGDHNGSKTMNISKMKQDINLAFKFLVAGKVVQWTQTRYLTCPWCQLNFNLVIDLFSTLTKMMTHLNYMHPKFTFTCKKLTNSAVFMKSLSKRFITIDVSLAAVSVNDWDIGLMVTEKLPTRRMPLTEIIYSKYQRPITKQYRAHHHRDYCHTWSSLKSKYLEFDIDSECDENMAWMLDHYERKVEEFSDLNHIEKRVIQMWNDTLLRYGLQVGDHQMPRFVDRFIGDLCKAGHRVSEARGLRNTLLLHLVNLVDYGVLPPMALVRCMRCLDTAIAGLAS